MGLKVPSLRPRRKNLTGAAQRACSPLPPLPRSSARAERTPSRSHSPAPQKQPSVELQNGMQEKSRARPAVSLYLVGEEEGEGPGGV